MYDGFVWISEKVWLADFGNHSGAFPRTGELKGRIGRDIWSARTLQSLKLQLLEYLTVSLS